MCACGFSWRKRESEGRKDEWEGFSFHLHKECRIKGMRQVLPPNWRSARSPVRNNHCQRDFFPSSPCSPSSPPLPSVFLSPVSFFAGGLGKRSVGRNYFGIADSAVGTAFLRASAKMAAGFSNCGRAPPRPGCLLKTQEEAEEARHSKPPLCPEPSSAKPSLAPALRPVQLSKPP